MQHVTRHRLKGVHPLSLRLVAVSPVLLVAVAIVVVDAKMRAVAGSDPPHRAAAFVPPPSAVPWTREGAPCNLRWTDQAGQTHHPQLHHLGLRRLCASALAALRATVAVVGGESPASQLAACAAAEEHAWGDLLVVAAGFPLALLLAAALAGAGGYQPFHRWVIPEVRPWVAVAQSVGHA